MEKKSGLGLFLFSVIALGSVMAGCDAIGPSDTTTTLRATTTTAAATTTSTAAGTTTTTAGGTTTTTAGATTTTTTSTTTTTVRFKISGTISQGASPEAAWDYGVLWVGVSTNEFNTFIESSYDAKIINTGETSATYEVAGLPPGTYYLVAGLYPGTTEAAKGWPPYGTRMGEFSDGLFKLFGSGTPEPVVITNSAVTNKDWMTELVMPTLEGTVSGTIINLNTLTMTTDVNVLKVNASYDVNNLVNTIRYFTVEAVTSSETTQNYTINIGQQGEYYIWGVLQPNRSVPGSIHNFDYGGEYSDGLMSPGMVNNWILVSDMTTPAKNGNPSSISSGGDDITGINFDFKAIRVP